LGIKDSPSTECLKSCGWLCPWIDRRSVRPNGIKRVGLLASTLVQHPFKPNHEWGVRVKRCGGHGQNALNTQGIGKPIEFGRCASPVEPHVCQRSPDPIGRGNKQVPTSREAFHHRVRGTVTLEASPARFIANRLNGNPKWLFWLGLHH